MNIYTTQLAKDIKSNFIKQIRSINKFYNIPKNKDDPNVWEQAASLCQEMNVNADVYTELCFKYLPKTYIYPKSIISSKIVNKIRNHIKENNIKNVSAGEYVDYWMDVLNTIFKTLEKSKKNNEDKTKIDSLGGIKFFLRSDMYVLPAWLKMCMSGGDIIIKDRYYDKAIVELNSIKDLKSTLEARGYDLSWL